MGKYNKRICEVDAFRWDGDNYGMKEPDWIVEATKDGNVWFHSIGTPECLMLTRGQGGHVYSAKIGDFIIRESNGDIHPYKPFAFLKDYVPVI